MPVTERRNDDIVIQDHKYSPEIRRKNQKFITSKKFSIPDEQQKKDYLLMMNRLSDRFGKTNFKTIRYCLDKYMIHEELKNKNVSNLIFY